MRKPLLVCISGLSLAAVVALVLYARADYVRVQENPSEIRGGVERLNAAQNREIDDIRMKAVYMEMDIIQAGMDGNANPTQDDLKEYVSDLQWAKKMVPLSATAAVHDVDRDIAWCHKRLKKS